MRSMSDGTSYNMPKISCMLFSIKLHNSSLFSSEPIDLTFSLTFSDLKREKQMTKKNRNTKISFIIWWGLCGAPIIPQRKDRCCELHYQLSRSIYQLPHKIKIFQFGKERTKKKKTAVSDD